MPLKFILTICMCLISLPSFALDIGGETRLGLRQLHNEGAYIARYLMENEVTLSHNKIQFIGNFNLYSMQDWGTHVNQEKAWLTSVDGWRYSFQLEGRYWLTDYLSVYSRYYHPSDRHDPAFGWGAAQSYSWDNGFILKW